MTGTPFTHVKIGLKSWDPRKNVFEMYGDSCENLLDILAVVILSSPISSVCRYRRMSHVTQMNQTARKASWNNMGIEPGDQEGPGC